MADRHNDPPFDEVTLDGLSDRGLTLIGELPAPTSPLKRERRTGRIGPVTETPAAASGSETLRAPEVDSPTLTAPTDETSRVPDRDRLPPTRLPEPAKEGADSFFQVLFAFITLLLTLSFPLGVITLWLQLASDYAFGFWTSLYVAAVTAKTMAIGEVAIVLLCSLFTLLPMLVWYSLRRAELFSRGGFGRWIFLLLPLVTFVLFGVVVYLTQWVSIDPGQWMFYEFGSTDSRLWYLALSFAIVGGPLGYFWLGRSIESRSLRESRGVRDWNFWRGWAAVYLGSIAVGICLAGLQGLSLPEVRLEASKDELQTARLLSNSGSYWYVIGCDGIVQAEPNKATPDEPSAPPESTTTAKNEGGERKVIFVEDSTSVTDCSVEPPSDLYLVDRSNGTAAMDDDNLTNDNTPTIRGTAEAGSIVYLYKDSDKSELGSVQAGRRTGKWGTTSGTLPDGTYSLTAKATDAAKNSSKASDRLSLTIDATKPDAPIGLALDASTDSGTKGDLAQGDGVTNDNTPTINGTAEVGSIVYLYKDSDKTELGRYKVADSTGKWSITSEALHYGTYSLTAKTIDAAGNISDASDPLSVTIDAQVPPPSPAATPKLHKKP